MGIVTTHRALRLMWTSTFTEAIRRTAFAALNTCHKQKETSSTSTLLETLFTTSARYQCASTSLLFLWNWHWSMHRYIMRGAMCCLSNAVGQDWLYDTCTVFAKEMAQYGNGYRCKRWNENAIITSSLSSCKSSATDVKAWDCDPKRPVKSNESLLLGWRLAENPSVYLSRFYILV